MDIFKGALKREGKVNIEKLDSENRNIYVISDLHIASGLNANGNFDGTENFYADQSFVRFVDYLQEKVKGKTGILIINGDFIDFLRIRDIPKSDDDFRCWQEMLRHADIEKTVEELRGSIVEKEVKYGLKTNDYKSIWKLYCCIQGHKKLFKRLAQWVEDGNELVIVKGNHDLEWYWPKLQAYLKYKLATIVTDANTETGTIRGELKARIRFINDALLIDNRIYVEHGHQYERTTAVVGEPIFGNDQELTLPFGSFFNRYLINRVALSYPYIDNVRPQQNILSLLLRERFPLALVLIFNYVPFALRIIPKKLWKHTLKYLLNFLFIILLPLGLFAYFIIKAIKGFDTSHIPNFLLSALQSVAMLFLSYLIGRIVAFAGLKTPPTFSVFANDFLNNKDNMQYVEVSNKEALQNADIEAVLMGHTHDPEQRNLTLQQEHSRSKFSFERSKPKPKKSADTNRAKWYFNTGTWIPILETSSNDVREDKTYTFIAINCGEDPPCGERLQRWNDDAGRADTLTLNDKI